MSPRKDETHTLLERRLKMKLEDLLNFLDIDYNDFAKLNPALIADTLRVAEKDDFNKVHQWGYVLKGEINDIE